MARGSIWLLLLLTGCGRLGYDAFEGGNQPDASVDAAPVLDGASDVMDAAIPDAPAPDVAPDAAADVPLSDAPADAPAPDAAPLDAPVVLADALAPDAMPDSGPAGCAPALFWRTDFNEDPTTIDVNGDEAADWARRGTMPFPAEQVADGVWNAASGIALDTRPFDSFATRTLVDVSMESLGVPQTYGAVFWINVNGVVGQQFSAVHVSLERTAGGDQRLRLFGKAAGSSYVLTEVTGLPLGFVRVQLDIDVPNRRVDLWTNSVHAGRHVFSETGPPQDPFATLISWGNSGGARFDRAEIVTCAP